VGQAGLVGALITIGIANLISLFIGLAHLLGLGLLAGLGFTISIFIAPLCFGNNPQLLTEAKVSIMLATFAAGLMGILWLWFLSHRKKSIHSHL
jgi:NhaA family Na+:H+ antiporter